MSWGNQETPWEDEDAPLHIVSPSTLIKLHRVNRAVPTEEQAKSLRGIRERDRYNRVFTK